MDYKKIIKKRETRIRILKLLNWIPDKIMLKLQYRIHMGRRLHLKNPRRYTEKLQAYKCFYRNNNMGTCVDKYKVRQFVASRGLSDNLTKLYGVYTHPSEIDFSVLPSKFVIKSNYGAASLGVIICRDKTLFDIDRSMNIMSSWDLSRISIPSGREWAYSQIQKRCILIEEYLDNADNVTESPNDYKILCFNGEPRVFWVETERTTGLKRNFYDAQCKPLDVRLVYPSNPNYELVDRNIIEELFAVARKLSEGFPHVRVDLYYTNRPIFGEMTFYTDSGYGIFSPDSFDKELGDMFDVSEFLK